MNPIGHNPPGNGIQTARNRKRMPPARTLHPRAVTCGLLAALLVVLSPAPPVYGWGDRAHFLITEEAVRRLPEPLKGLFSRPRRLRRLQEASTAPDHWRKKGTEHYRPGERPRHFFDIDAMTEEPYPFPNFPRDRRAAEAQFGRETFQKYGQAPWAAVEVFESLIKALTDGRTEAVFEHAGAMAHYAADLHMPFHTTKNYDGKETGNPGIHKALETGLFNRYADFYAAEVQKDRRVVPYIEHPQASLFDWLIEAHARVPTILEADTPARARTGYNPKEYEEAPEGELSDLDNVDSARARPYYTCLREELEKRGSPEAIQLRLAAQHVAELLYTAWVRAGKPLSLSAPAPEPQAPSGVPYWVIGVALAIVLVLVWPRRKTAS